MSHVHRIAVPILILGFFFCTTQVIAQVDSLPPLRKAITLFGGAALPTGALAATSGSNAGFAKTGFVLGAEFTTEMSRHFVVGLEGSYNSLPMDEATIQSFFRILFGINNITVSADSWVTIGAFGNVGFTADISSAVHFYGRGKLGIAFGTTPKISIVVNNVPITQNSASASAFAYGFGFGVIVNNAFDIGVHFLSSEPTYSGTTQGGGQSLDSKFSQPTSIFQLRVGYSFEIH